MFSILCLFGTLGGFVGNGSLGVVDGTGSPNRFGWVIEASRLGLTISRYDGTCLPEAVDTVLGYKMGGELLNNCEFC